MTYTVGISSGIYIEGAKDSASYAGLSKKIYAAVLYGVNFIQLDLQHLTEFLEPNLDANMKKIKESGYTFGLHGECASFGSPILLDSAIEEEYKMANDKFKKHIEESAKIGAKYVLFHSSESTPFPLAIGHDLKDVRLVDPWGNPLNKFLDDHPSVLEWAIGSKFINEIVLNRHRIPEEEDLLESEKRRYEETNKKTLDGNELNKMKKEIKDKIRKIKENILKEYVVSGDHIYLPDRIAYPIIAKWMEETNHPLWESLAKGKKFESIEGKFEEWVPAVTAMYIAGHFESKNKYGSLKDILNKNKMPVVFETPMAHQPGYELYMRLPGLVQIYTLINYINSNYAKMAVDFEHLMTCNIDPKKEIESLPSRAGDKILVIHAGAPVPYAKAHMAIELGSDAQRYLYERLWELRQKGFKEGYLIYERAGEEGIKSSILSLRMIKEFLEKETEPKKLPMEFYGLDQKGPDFARQQLQIRQHALDPLKGMLTVPEEEHGFFSGAAVRKGKAKEWSEGEYK
ncbi:MAG: hypothetical protein PHU12_00405 [Candidatus Aenigmarchaeota archaeon]|nr:hypothetical protein [Candidatus Aenigmarchaeota archaeon]